MIKIYLADLANDLNGIDIQTIPIGVGYVGAFCKKTFDKEVDLQIFRTFKPFWRKVCEAPPDIVGFGCYDWNAYLSLAAAELLKRNHPGCLTVIGGANVDVQPKDNKRFLQENPQIDFLVYGDGEKPFARIVRLFLQHQNEHDPIMTIKQTPVDGTRTLVADEIVMGSPTDSMMDLNVIPSPYLTGLFDKLLDNTKLMPIIQNVRGCPYSCRYCVSGSQTSKVRHFSYERLTAEIDYLRINAKNRILRLSDDNFGIIEHDIQIAKFIRNMFDTHKYPSILKAYSAKKLDKKTRQIAIILKPLMIMCISLQTTTPEVLKATKRFSTSARDIRFNLDFACKNGIKTGTELIFGLPGETLDSMKDVINNVMELHFDSIGISYLMLLKGSDLYRPKSRKEYQYRSKFLLGENAVTIHDDLFSFEIDEVAVSSKDYSYQDWLRFLRYQFLLELTHRYGYARELIYHLLSEGVKAIELFDELLDNKTRYPTVGRALDDYVYKCTGYMFDSQKELLKFVQSQINRWLTDKEALASTSRGRILFTLFVRYIFNDRRNGVLTDIHNATLNLYNGTEYETFRETTGLLLDLSIALMINPKEEFIDRKEYTAKYNVFAWIQERYRQPLSSYAQPEGMTFILQSQNQHSVTSAIASDKEQNRSDCYNFLVYLNSSLLRRHITGQVGSETKETLHRASPHISCEDQK
jgi:radical SAM superfamily enzyme YgiQ (UPF0313 family)